jgi:hypothetical protein
MDRIDSRKNSSHLHTFISLLSYLLLIHAYSMQHLHHTHTKSTSFIQGFQNFSRMSGLLSRNSSNKRKVEGISFLHDSSECEKRNMVNNGSKVDKNDEAKKRLRWKTPPEIKDTETRGKWTDWIDLSILMNVHTHEQSICACTYPHKYRQEREREDFLEEKDKNLSALMGWIDVPFKKVG